MKQTYLKIILILIFPLMFSGCMALSDVFYDKIEYNERDSINKILNIIQWKLNDFRKHGKYLDETFKDNFSDYYIFEINVKKNSFEISAVPKEYKKSGKNSFYVNSEDGDIRGANIEGRKATINDPIIKAVSPDLKKELDINKYKY